VAAVPAPLCILHSMHGCGARAMAHAQTLERRKARAPRPIFEFLGELSA